MAFVSTGHLPPLRERCRALVAEAHERYSANDDGEQLAGLPGARRRAEATCFGICVVGTDGADLRRGRRRGRVHDHERRRSRSSSRSSARRSAPTGLRELLGVNGTGLPFNSLEAVERSGDGRTNPMVNSGRDRGDEPRPRGRPPRRSGRSSTRACRASPAATLRLNEEVYRSASETNDRNQALAGVLERLGRIYCDPAEATDLYTRQCCLDVSATDLAVMGATLADGGVNPLTGERVVDPGRLPVHARRDDDRRALRDLRRLALRGRACPGKSGIGGGIVTVSPGKGGLGTFAPRLDEAGNSVKGQLAARVPLVPARPRRVRLGAGGVIARARRARGRCWLLLACRRSRAPPRRTSRRWRSASRRWCSSSPRHTSAAPASRTSRSTSTRSSASRRSPSAVRGARATW